jgi:hypothetical protein
MGYQLINLLMLIIIGVILALMIKNASGTQAFFNGLGGLWGTSINGILGQTSNS